MGNSSVAIMTGRLQVAKAVAAGASILIMLPNTDERYLSKPLFENVEANMNE